MGKLMGCDKKGSSMFIITIVTTYTSIEIGTERNKYAQT